MYQASTKRSFPPLARVVVVQYLSKVTLDCRYFYNNTAGAAVETVVVGLARFSLSRERARERQLGQRKRYSKNNGAVPLGAPKSCFVVNEKLFSRARASPIRSIFFESRRISCCCIDHDGARDDDDDGGQ